jgi:hypothetical protein
VRLLVALPRPSNVGGRSATDRARRLVAAWLANPDVRTILRVNRWDGVDWFGRDEWHDLLDWALLLDTIDGSPAQLRASRSVVERLGPLADSAGFRVDRLAELAGPSPRTTRAAGKGAKGVRARPKHAASPAARRRGA